VNFSQPIFNSVQGFSVQLRLLLDVVCVVRGRNPLWVLLAKLLLEDAALSFE
jgi:hypothetical protein